MAIANPSKKWSIAWVFLALAFALHVVDEALTGFLPFSNSIVASIQESFSWIPLPTFSFPVWITGLIIGVLVLIGLSPMAFAGNRDLRQLGNFLGVLMTGNALGHVGASIYLRKMASGVFSSPVLLIAALALLVQIYGTRRNPRQLSDTI